MQSRTKYGNNCIWWLKSICLPTLVSSENNNKTPSLTRSANIPTQKGALSLSLIVVPYQSGALAVLSVSRPPVVPRALDATESSGQSMGKGRVYCPPLQPEKLFLWSWTFCRSSYQLSGRLRQKFPVNIYWSDDEIIPYLFRISSSTPLTLRTQSLQPQHGYSVLHYYRKVYILTRFKSEFLDNCLHCFLPSLSDYRCQINHFSLCS
jgi:hypothetical protein